ncbi:MAG: putative inorganic carbon transporter subunit DabA, partial [Pseudomonadota bacterium]
ARLLATLLNDPEVRAGLPDHGIEVPTDTVFVAGLHDTVSDDVTLYDVPVDVNVERLRDALRAAARIARTERAVRLSGVEDSEAIPARGADWAEIRQEWGLAGCHAFVAAPRFVTAGRDLGGRTFLHSYDWRADDGFGTLELILTAPVVVASWIALQYHGSTTAPAQFGAGDKLLHNVTGGIGVIEGSGGHLRAGLPWQSVHDGTALQHEATRLAVVIAAPTDAIDGVLAAHPGVHALFVNGWLSLHAMADDGQLTHRHSAAGWTEIST